ncbi:M12 family metallopeptidase, partial [Salmonella sp. s54836]|uniref:M12 family metallopeptidase n=1 Tax=Salmonella sp. s54836 TaxID=3159673 RepID=UPI00397E99FA
MHYGQTAFGGGRMTIQAIDPNNQRLIGQRSGFSEIDIKQINLMYCGGTVPTSGPSGGCDNKHSDCQYWATNGY